MVSMEAGRASSYRDNKPVPLTPLSLGLSSVRLIVNKFESQYTRASDDRKHLSKYDPNIDEGYDDDFHLERSRRQVFIHALWSILNRWIPSVSFGNFGVLAVATGLFAPKMISHLVLYPFCRLVFGTLYPAYASYKAVRTKNLKEYVKWMMYWIVFALFTCTETFTDMFLSWFPFYYEVKIVLVLWLLSPATKGSSILYRKFVHPALCRREQEIDEYIAKAKDQGYHTVLNLGTKGVNYATTVIMQTAIKGGGGIVQQIRKSYSLSDLTECDPREERSADEADDVMTEQKVIRRVPKSGYNTRRSASESNNRSPMYFPEVDVEVRPRPRSDEPDFSHIKSTEDISSGYSSADNSVSLTRTASLGTRARSRPGRTAVTAIKRPQAAEGSEVIIEELHDEDFEYANMPSLVNLPAQIFMSHTVPPFLYQYVGDQVRIIQVLGENPLVPNNLKDNNTTDNDVDSSNRDDKIDDDGKSTASDTNEKEFLNVIDSKEAKDIKETRREDENNASIESDVLEIVEDNVKDNNECEKIENNTDNKQNLPKIESVGEEKVVTENEKSLNVVNLDKDDNKIGCAATEYKRSSKDDGTISSVSLNNSAESGDDEASFGTPDNSPKSKRKLTKGRYGKPKAPPPPVADIIKPKQDFNLDVEDTNRTDKNCVNTSQESLVDIVNRLPNTAFKDTGHKSIQIVNPIAENKRRHKSKSPGNIQKGNPTTIGKLLQLPAKLAFWKSDDKSKSDVSESNSRRSSNVDQGALDEFQSCADLTKITGESKSEDQLSFKDVFLDGEDITQDIIEKSDALQKLIEAKIESHPEYKIVALHAEIPTTSKSTDV